MTKRKKMYCPVCGKYRAPYRPEDLRYEVCRACYERRRPEFARYRDLLDEHGVEEGKRIWEQERDTRVEVSFNNENGKNEDEKNDKISTTGDKVATTPDETDHRGSDLESDNKTPETVWRCEHCNEKIQFAERICHKCGKFVDWRVPEVINHPSILVCSKCGTISIDGTCEVCRR